MELLKDECSPDGNRDKLCNGSSIRAQKPEKNISKTFACTPFPPTFAAPISSFEYPHIVEIRNPADSGLGD